MDENLQSVGGDVNTYAILALDSMLRKDPEAAEAWLRSVSRSDRGRVFRAAEDLQMIISRMGND